MYVWSAPKLINTGQKIYEVKNITFYSVNLGEGPLRFPALVIMITNKGKRSAHSPKLTG